MKARLPLVALLVTAAAVAGLACNRSGARLRDAASEDLHCPPSQVHILGASRTKDVSACGHTATYKFEDGEWYMTMRDGQPVSPGQPQQKAGPPGVAPAQPVQPVQPTTGTPSMPPSSPPPPAGQKL